MQKRAKDAKELTYNTEYDPYEDFLQKTPSKLRIGYHDPDFALISGLHYHDVVEVGLCLEGNGIFIVDGQMIPFVAPCVNVIYPILQYIDIHFPFLSQKFVPPCLIHNNASISG